MTMFVFNRHKELIINSFFQIVRQFQEDIENNTNYVAGIVHDLRNPLSVIYSCSELLTQLIPVELQQGELQEVLLACNKNSQNLISMVSNILDFAKLKSKKLELDLQPTSIKEIISNVVEMHSIKAKQKSLKLGFQMDEESFPDKVFLDQSRTTQILINLVANALKFTDKGGVQVYFLLNTLIDSS